MEFAAPLPALTSPSEEATLMRLSIQSRLSLQVKGD